MVSYMPFILPYFKKIHCDSFCFGIRVDKDLNPLRAHSELRPIFLYLSLQRSEKLM